MEISSQKFGDQPLKIQIVRKFYLSDQNWYPIHFLKETAVVRFELLRTKTKHFIFLDGAFYIVFIVKSIFHM